MFYYFMILISVALMFVISAVRRKRFGYTDKQSLTIVFIGCISGYLGAKLLYCMQNPGEPLSFTGMSFFGTVIFAPAGLWIAARLTRQNYGGVLDFAGIYIPLALAFARIGCFHNDCCGSVLMTLPNGEYFKPPIQLIESGLDLITFLALLHWERRGAIRFPGEQYPKFVMIYSFIRMIMEVYRFTPKDKAGMSVGQWLSVCGFAVALLTLCLITKVGIKKEARKKAVQQKKK